MFALSHLCTSSRLTTTWGLLPHAPQLHPRTLATTTRPTTTRTTLLPDRLEGRLGGHRPPTRISHHRCPLGFPADHPAVSRLMGFRAGHPGDNHRLDFPVDHQEGHHLHRHQGRLAPMGFPIRNGAPTTIHNRTRRRHQTQLARPLPDLQRPVGRRFSTGQIRRPFTNSFPN